MASRFLCPLVPGAEVTEDLSQVFTPKDKLADWFEHYADVLELNVWTNTNLKTSSWDDSSQQWTVVLDRQQSDKHGERERDPFRSYTCPEADNTPGTLHPRHIILATGHSGEPYMPTDISGFSDFQGDRLTHSSDFTEPTKNAKGKKAVVIGSCNSGHDIARDYYDHGYDVTMVQRSSTLVVTSKTLNDVTMAGVYDESGVRYFSSCERL